ncbi:MAG TPA: glycoside hydrolase N-terminal domain-containing protein [Flavitalea sp.]|nr:glycoside hydrolase N-terminal domain-containing protein [Flavitalea sp.]
MKGIFLFLALNFSVSVFAQSSDHDLRFDSLATSWDEAIPLGNGTVGSLIWKKEGNLRFSLDRADLWDMRPMKGLHRKEFSYQFVQQKVKEKDYKIVQEYFDVPYDKEPAPTKIPAAALEFDIRAWGKVRSVRLDITEALCTVEWENGVILETYVHATQPVGWFRFRNVSNNFQPEIIAPRYQGTVQVTGDPVGGDDLSRLGYKEGTIRTAGHRITYHQPGYNGFSYEVSVTWIVKGSTVEGVWSVSSQFPGKNKLVAATQVTERAIGNGFKKNLVSHLSWWKQFWASSSIEIPDKPIEKQWYLEQYKFGSATRRGAPPISLQAVWTADNGRIPPWKGDYHHDLNTQLSYWPAYSGNHLEEALAYLDHLDENKSNYKRYTKLFFGKEGLAVPGVTTLDGTEMGGWIQYSLSPTVSAWLAQHYYLQWRYAKDRNFLKNRAYPWLKDVAVFLESITYIDSSGHRKLPISSSPEINNNSLDAWFDTNTNYDLALMKFAFMAASELAKELGLHEDESRWKKIRDQFSDFAKTPSHELMFAASMPYNQSHRHFSHAMAIYPLGLITWEQGIEAQQTITNTLKLLDKIGPAEWCGYSYAWLASLKARAKDGTGAATALDIFRKAFCSVNSFHLNGDQTKSGYSNFQYRPFTLEGNFAFASGLQEMLIQSYAGFIEVLPAIPATWKDISFHNLRAEGAFLVSLELKSGLLETLKIVSEKGGATKLKLLTKSYSIRSQHGVTVSENGEYLNLNFEKGGEILLIQKK